MREILFRGKTEGKWRKAEWVEGFYCYRRYKYAGDKSFISELHTITTGIIEASGAYQEREDERKYTVVPETVGQYTGLTDKNGKKIFEGDIVKCKHDWQNQGRTMDTDEVAFLGQKIRGAYGKYIDKTLGEFFRWRYHYFRNYAVEYYALNGGWRVRNGSCFHSLTQTYITNRDLEVIGNIHDNPELLKGSESDA